MTHDVTVSIPAEAIGIGCPCRDVFVNHLLWLHRRGYVENADYIIDIDQPFPGTNIVGVWRFYNSNIAILFKLTWA